MSATIISAQAVKAAYDTTATVATAWARAYSATRIDIAAGSSVRDIAAAWKAAKVTPANAANVGDFAEAARLSDVGDAYYAAVGTVVGEGAILYPHILVMRARKARGMAYVRATLSAMETVLSVEDVTDEDRSKAVVKAVRTLAAAKREQKTDEGASTEGATDEGATDEGATDEGASTEATADSRADSVIAVLNAMVSSGDVPSVERQRTITETVRALMALWKAAESASDAA